MRLKIGDKVRLNNGFIGLVVGIYDDRNNTWEVKVREPHATYNYWYTEDGKLGRDDYDIDDPHDVARILNRKLKLNLP